ncbi:MAG TPA: hypothetical protein VN213_08440, partial [Solirubrobacteraceae bacterium]|nr:hypothetical protein [Solirubrobacteraceae bacterium]
MSPARDAVGGDGMATLEGAHGCARVRAVDPVDRPVVVAGGAHSALQRRHVRRPPLRGGRRREQHGGERRHRKAAGPTHRLLSTEAVAALRDGGGL